MNETTWDVPQTEEGLRDVLRRIDECRAAGEENELGKGLLALSHLVKWVRSDTDQVPFARSHELAMEALELFRRTQDEKGQVRALIAATPMAGPQQDQFLAEAELLAGGIGDEDLLGSVVWAKARATGLSDRERSAALNNQALGIFRRTGNLGGQAGCLFSLSIQLGTSAEKREFALESAKLYREIGRLKDASRSMSIALMNAEEIDPPAELEKLVLQGLKDSRDSGYGSQEAMFCEKLAKLAAAQGRFGEAADLHRRAKEAEPDDGLTPFERWENDVEMTKSIIALAKAQGSKEAETMFREHLKELKAQKPKA